MLLKKIFWFWWRKKKKSDSEFLSYNLMLNAGSGYNTNIRQPMLKLKTNSGYHDLFLNFPLKQKITALVNCVLFSTKNKFSEVIFFYPC
jgi:hypothetical protein